MQRTPMLCRFLSSCAIALIAACTQMPPTMPTSARQLMLIGLRW